MEDIIRQILIAAIVFTGSMWLKEELQDLYNAYKRRKNRQL